MTKLDDADQYAYTPLMGMGHNNTTPNDESILVRLPKKLHDDIVKMASDMGLNKSAYVRWILIQVVKGKLK